MANITVTQGAHHIGLTVLDLQQTRDFFIDTLGFKQVGEKPDYPAVFVSDGSIMITLWQAVHPEQAKPFDRKHVIGLHHFALKVDSLSTLNNLHQTLSQTPGVEIEFAPESLGGTPMHHMMCAIPSGIRMELIAAG
ncbi:VOC family protein [Acaryochloris sp. IP29b_bin.148]|uniref:VOC family protein n=1 Tax=Acaryochloris sp. IP29b_bin.148 TaxID=2969218 RepID=UPI00260B9E58|nr:VOC family protein [Acaryochloris sp. IP29b_bin.148]